MFSRFVNAFTASPVTRTENGALSYATTSNGRVDLFFKLVRGITSTNMDSLLAASWAESPVDTCKIIFHCRDCRGGKGERKILEQFFDWLVRTGKSVTATELCPHIAEYGRWDDLVKLCRYQALRPTCFAIIAAQLQADLAAGADTGVSLLAKWLPTEGKKLDKELGFVTKFCKHLGINKAEYRKRYLRPLRQRLDLVETALANGDIGAIDYAAVPSCAMMKYRKTFAKKDATRFTNWLALVKRGESKVNAGQLYPHEIVEKYMGQLRYPHSEPNPLFEEQWKVLKAEIAEQRVLADCIWLADMSGSMSGTPMNVAMALSLLCSDTTEGPFQGCVMSFSDHPVFHKIEGDTLLSQMQCMSKKMSPSGAWGMSTNLQAVFDLILHKAREHQLKPEGLPKTVYILSDM